MTDGKTIIIAMKRKNIPPMFLPDNRQTQQPVGRLLYDVDFNNGNKDLIQYMTRGLVIEVPSGKLLTYPRQSIVYGDIQNNDKMEKLKNNICNYTVYAARDGTTVSLYTYKGSLCMATKSSWDISRNLWNGKISFAEMFYHAASKTEGVIKDLGLTITNNRLSWNIPDNISVTFGMRHHAIHVLDSDPEYIWLINATNMDTLDDVTLPQLERVEKEIIISDPVLHKMLLTCNTAIDVALRSNNTQLTYGYILKSKTHNMFLPSTLYDLLRTCLYEPVNSIPSYMGSNRFMYNLISIMLLQKTNDIAKLVKLLPWIDGDIHRIQNFIQNLCDEVKKYLHSKCLNKNISALASRIGDIIAVNESDYVLVLDTAQYDIIPSYIYGPDYISDIYNAFIHHHNS